MALSWVRLIAGGGALTMVAAACGTGSDSASEPVTGDPDVELPAKCEEVSPEAMDQVASTPAEDVPSALPALSGGSLENDEFPEPLVEPADLRVVLQPDSIPAIDDPKFLPPECVDFLHDVEPVIAVEVNGEARAYPMQIMMWHEIVNDTIAGSPVTVTYCPLCNTAVAYDRRLGDRILDFGTSGGLYFSALVMYDRQTESLWSHFTAEGLAGVLAGRSLDTYPAQIVSWEAWRDAHPDGLVLSRDTGHSRAYGDNPYDGYDDIDEPPFLFDEEVDGRLAGKERIVAFGQDEDPVAVRLDEVADSGVYETDLDGDPVVVLHIPGTASGLEAGNVAGGRDVGAVGVFRPVVDGEKLSFSRDGDGFVDEETGSRWDIFGLAASGPLEGTQLEQIEHVDTFWFAWAAYSPDTRIEPEP